MHTASAASHAARSTPTNQSLAPADRAWRPKIAPVLTEGAAGDGSRGRIGATSSPTGQHPVSPSSARSGGKSSSAGPRRTPSGQSPEPGASSDAGGSDSPVRPRRLPPLSSSPSADSPASPELSRRILRVPSNIDRRDTAGGADHISRGSNGGGAASPLASERKSPRLRRMSIGRSSGSGGGNQPDASPRIDRRGSPSVSEGDGQPSGLTRVSSGRGAGTTASPGGGGKGERQTARTRAEAKDVSAFSLRDEQWDRDKLLRACRIVAGQLEEEAAGRGEAPTKGGRRQSRTVTPVAADAGPVVPSYNIWSKDLEAQLLLRASQVMRRERGPKLGQAGGVLAALRRAARDMRAASLITDHIVIGSKEDAANLDTLFGLGVTHVLNAAADSAPSPFEYDVLYFDLQLEDEADFPIAAFFRAASSFLAHVEEVKGRCLVHCVSGVSRSSTLVMAHLMLRHHMTLKAAFNHVRDCRPFTWPNQGFKLALAKFEVELKGATSVVNHPDWNFFEWNSIKHGYPSDQLRPTVLCGVQ